MKNTVRFLVRFLLNDEMRELADFDPSMTIPQYLRLNERLCGTKEGCAEGDCGACTVVLGELSDDQALSYHAVNSCMQFLPTLDDKQRLTIEHLGSPEQWTVFEVSLQGRGPYFLGDRYSLLDIFALMMATWFYPLKDLLTAYPAYRKNFILTANRPSVRKLSMRMSWMFRWHENSLAFN